jgi:hypothetical protein
MGKLHELLAVEKDITVRTKEFMRELGRLFALDGSFFGKFKSYRALEEGGLEMPNEVSNAPTTAYKELERLSDLFAGWVDASVQKEETNADTTGSLTVGEEVLFLTSPTLLNLENKLSALLSTLKGTPTLDPAETWVWDDSVGTWQSQPRITYRTDKRLRSHEASPATDRHPAQVQTFSEDVRIGEWTTVIASGMLSADEKKALVSRTEALLLDVVRARQRANDEEVKNIKIGNLLTSQIFSDIL